ncbi:hypothetical protein STEG23_008723, partial [Scotinomys teguina]
SVPYPVIIREASSSSRCEQMQRPTARHHMERESKWEVSIKWMDMGKKIIPSEAYGYQVSHLDRKCRSVTQSITSPRWNIFTA